MVGWAAAVAMEVQVVGVGTYQEAPATTPLTHSGRVQLLLEELTGEPDPMIAVRQVVFTVFCSTWQHVVSSIFFFP